MKYPKGIIYRIYHGKLTKKDSDLGLEQLVKIAIDWYKKTKEHKKMSKEIGKDFDLACERKILVESLPAFLIN